MEDIDVELSQLADLAHIQIGRREKRPLCNRCRRPVGVCWCRDLDGVRVSTGCRVVVLQHPHEEKRCLRTAPILQAALPSHAYLEIKAKRFPFSRFPQLEEILTSPRSVLMYPGERATGLDTLPPVGPNQQPYNIIIIDGTWQQAKSMYHNCRHLHTLPQVCLSGQYVSKYVIRTQPTEDALSTVETAAIALATLEQNWSIYTTLLHPLHLLCQYQIKHGAVPHQSKEQMIASGRCRKPMGKRTFKKLRKCGAKQSEGTNLSSFITSIQKSNDANEGTSERCEDHEDYRMREHEGSNHVEKEKHICEEQATTEVEQGLSRMEKQEGSTENCMCEGRNHTEKKGQIGNEQVVVAKDCMTLNDGDGNCMERGDQACTEQKGLVYDYVKQDVDEDRSHNGKLVQICKKPEGLVEDRIKQEMGKGRNLVEKIEPKSEELKGAEECEKDNTIKDRDSNNKCKYTSSTGDHRRKKQIDINRDNNISIERDEDSHSKCKINKDNISIVGDDSHNKCEFNSCPRERKSSDYHKISESRVETSSQKKDVADISGEHR